MLGNPHEVLHRIFQERPTLFSHAHQRVLDIDQYEKYEVTEVDTDLTEEAPMVRQVDTLLKLTRDGDEHYAIVEAQLGRDEKKRASWPHYIAHLHDKYNCPVTLLVVCNDAAVAKWARKPINIGPEDHPCMRVGPFVLGPDNVPRVTDLAKATDNVEFAILSALIHSKSNEAPGILNVLAPALDTIDIDAGEFFAELIAVGLGTAVAREYWRDLMTAQKYSYTSELHEKLHGEGRAEGRAEGEAIMLLQVLRARGIEVSEEVEERIRSCTDSDTLTAWGRRAVTVDTADEIFD